MLDDDHQEPAEQAATAAEEQAPARTGVTGDTEEQDPGGSRATGGTEEQTFPETGRSRPRSTAVLFQAPATAEAAPPPARRDRDGSDEGDSDGGSGQGNGAGAGQQRHDGNGEHQEDPRPSGEGEASSGEDDADAGESPESSDGSGGSGEDDADAGESPESSDGSGGSGGGRRRRRRGGRRRRKSGGGEDAGSGGGEDAGSGGGEDDPTTATTTGHDDRDTSGASTDEPDEADEDGAESEGGSRRRRRRRRGGNGGQGGAEDSQSSASTNGRSAEEQVSSVSGSTRLEAKKQRRREGREAGRRRAPVVSEAEFLARREAVERVMAIRQREDVTQLAVLEDDVLVEHYVARESQSSLIGNIYLGRVQNVLPSMEAAFIDIGQNRNGVIYAGEVNWAALGHTEGEPRKIESVLSSGQQVLVQVTKDPVGHKGARLTGQLSLAGRFLVYVPDGTNSGISRKLPDTERKRLKSLLKEIVPEGAGVIVRTAAEGAAEADLTRDVERLTARWEEIEKQAKKAGSAPKLLYGEPDLTVKVVRDLFTEDFSRLVVEGDDAWETVQGYVSHVAPDLEDRLAHHDPTQAGGTDVFATYRIDEQIAKGLERKVWLPSGGSLIFDRTEAMTVVDVNTGKFTGSGGNLEETVTKNNLEAAEEIVRQLRLRDIGGIIVIDFIDMVLESNRDLVLRRLVECLGRDRTRHQVAEVTSLGLVQMTRKRIGTGLLEAFSEKCTHCGGRGVHLHSAPVEPQQDDDRRGRRGRGRGGGGGGKQGGSAKKQGQRSAKQAVPSPADVAAMARPENATDGAAEEKSATEDPGGHEQPATIEPAASADEADGTEQPGEAGKKTGDAQKKSVTPGAADHQQSAAADEHAGADEQEQPGPGPAEQEDTSGGTGTTATTRARRRTSSRRTGVSTEAASITVAPGATATEEPVEPEEPSQQKPTVTTRTRRRGPGSAGG